MIKHCKLCCACCAYRKPVGLVAGFGCATRMKEKKNNGQFELCMCGILCCIGSSKPILSVLEDSVPGGPHHWECSDEGLIVELINKDLTSTQRLSSRDSLKLANVDQTRVLVTHLNRLKNSIAKSKAHAEELEAARTSLEIKIKALQLRDDLEVSQRAIEFGLLIASVAGRGPNYLGYIRWQAAPGLVVEQFSSVLSLRQPFSKQPVHWEAMSMQFNGELYNCDCLRGNDTQYVTSRLRLVRLNENREKALIDVLSRLEGEFAYVIIDKVAAKCYFGRDVVGRRSLLYSLSEERGLAIGSTLGRCQPCVECDANIVYIWDMKACTLRREPLTAGALAVTTTLSRNPSIVTERVKALRKHLCEATRVRLETIHPLNEQRQSRHVGILFSGGLDCSIIGGLVGQLCQREPTGLTVVDLITVGFDNPRTQAAALDSPDRKLAKASWLQLAAMFNGARVEFQLVEVDVTYEEWLRHRRRVEYLMFPAATEMDLSIAIAFYFASRAQNGMRLQLEPTTGEVMRDPGYNSKAKVLFSGLGADELFAGYLRHERVFSQLQPNDAEVAWRKSYAALAQELSTDINRIHVRNLGRDDRVMACWGKELRYPYLDEKVIAFAVNQVELDLKIQSVWRTVTSKRGISTTSLLVVRKWLLRELAAELGLHWVKNELKRAIQFGAKSAKMEVGQARAQGTDQLH